MNKISKLLTVAAIGIPLAIAVIQVARASKLQTENQSLRQAAARQSHRGTIPIGDIPAKTLDPVRGSATESDEAALARDAKAVDEQMKQAWALSDATREERERARFSLVAGGSALTLGAVKAAGLSDDQRHAVVGVLGNLWQKVSDDFSRRAVLVEDESDEEAGMVVYFVPARPDRGKEFKELLKVELDGKVGEAKRNILMMGIETYDFFGGFGRLDVRIEFQIREEVFKFGYLNPINGEPSCFGSHPLREFKDQFGDSFTLPDLDDLER